MVDRFSADLASWGCLVKSWATQLDYVGSKQYNDTAFSNQPPRAPLAAAASAAGKSWALPTMKPAPVTAATGPNVNLPFAIALTKTEFLNLLSQAAVANVHLPAQYQTVVIVQGSVDTMVVRLPPKDILQASEDDIIKNGYGAVPGFYQQLYTPTGATPIGPFMPSGQTAEMRLHANRIGDYTLNSCS